MTGSPFRTPSAARSRSGGASPAVPAPARPGPLLLPVALVALLALSGTGRAAGLPLPPRQGQVWQPFVEWRLRDDSVDGNPFDVEARAVFTHAESGDRVATDLFFDGDGGWRLRFTPTRPGLWRVETESADPDLDGWRGEVEAAPPADDARGFLQADGSWFARPAPDGTLRPTLWNVYEVPGEVLEHLGDLPRDPEERRRAIAGFLDEVERNGMDALMIRMYNNWFELGAFGHDEHDSENPDPASFALLEEVILAAHERGLGVHIWAWGDEQRGWTPVGVPGGINGEADRRLQRYIAARLGPLPDWTMSYGFDLNEWTTPDEVRSWASFIAERSGWPHLLTAREVDFEDMHFSLGDDKLPLVSSDARPTLEPEFDPYGIARDLLERVDAPVLFERRFHHERDGWTMQATRRALWQFAIAGGAGGIWGRWEGPPYPESGQLRVFRTFFERRLEPGLAPLDGVAEPGWALADEERSLLLVYAEDADEIRLDLEGAAGPLRLLAVDARAGAYEEIEGGELEPGAHVWTAPHRSDWALVLQRR